MSIALLCVDSWKDTAIGSPETIFETKTVDGWIQNNIKNNICVWKHLLLHHR